MMGAWSINVSGRVYGPFTSERMRSFVGEGRLAPHSLVARDGSADWREARDEPEFSEVFANRGAQPSAAAARAVAPAAPAPQPAQVALAPQPNAAFASHVQHASAVQTPDQQMAHFVVIAEIKAQSTKDIEGAISSLGPHYRLTQNVWIISTEQSVSAVRNRLLKELGKSDSLFVIDASRGKAAWFNFGPEADVRIRRVWQKTS